MTVLHTIFILGGGRPIRGGGGGGGGLGVAILLVADW